MNPRVEGEICERATLGASGTLVLRPHFKRSLLLLSGARSVREWKRRRDGNAEGERVVGEEEEEEWAERPRKREKNAAATGILSSFKANTWRGLRGGRPCTMPAWLIVPWSNPWVLGGRGSASVTMRWFAKHDDSAFGRGAF